MSMLKGMRVVEGSAFVAVPLAGMTLAQMGAEVIRFDRIGGGLDAGRWPLAPSGKSLFWAGMNKGKRSVAGNMAVSALLPAERHHLRSGEGQTVDLALKDVPPPCSATSASSARPV